MSPEPFDSRAKAPTAKRWEKGYGDENAMSPEPFDSRAKAPTAKRWEKGYGDENAVYDKENSPRSHGVSSSLSRVERKEWDPRNEDDK